MSPEAKGIRAQEILDDQVFKEAVTLADADATKRWKAAITSEAREACWRDIRSLDVVANQLRVIVGNGAVARHDRAKLEKSRDG